MYCLQHWTSSQCHIIQFQTKQVLRYFVLKIAVFNAVNIHSHCAGVSHWSNPRVLSLQCFCFDILLFAYYVTLHCSFVMYGNMIPGSKTNGNWETTRRDKLLGIFPLKHQAFVSSVSPSMLGWGAVCVTMMGLMTQQFQFLVFFSILYYGLSPP